MTHRADVSVVIPTRNRASLVEQAVESVLDQEPPAREVIVVDDGSTDDTAARLRRFADRVRVVQRESGGPGAARNTGIAVAAGTWVAFLDSDDLWRPGALAGFLRTAEEHPGCGLVAHLGEATTPDGRPTGRIIGKKSPGPFYTTASLLLGDAGGVLTPMVRRTLLLEVGGFDESLPSAEDCDFWLRLSFATGMVNSGKPLLLVREHPGSISRDRGENARSWLVVLEKLAREHPEFVRDDRRAYTRALAKEHLRLGRELLVRAAEDPELRREAREHLRRAARLRPSRARAWALLAASLSPSLYARFRRVELRWTNRLPPPGNRPPHPGT